MKIIQTLWTKPGLKAGWVDEIYHFMSWTYSCLQLRKFYDNVELYTDSLGKKILFDLIQLPYTKVYTNLDSFIYPVHLWAATKILSYGLQTEPFLHLDGDVYIMTPFEEKMLERPIVYQNAEYEINSNGFYSAVFEDLLSVISNKKDIPEWIENFPKNNVTAFCAGVFGGTEISFFKKHSQMAFTFFDKFAEDITKMKNPQYANHLAEQVLSYYLATINNVEHFGLFEPTYCNDPKTDSIDKNGYYAVNYFGISPHGKSYIHYIGGFKSNLKGCQILARRLYLDYPKYYDKIISLIPNIKKIVNSENQKNNTSYRLKVSTRHSIKSNIEKFTSKNIFPRTLYLSKNSNILLDSTISPKSFINKYENLLNDQESEMIKDAYLYEKNLYGYIQTMKTDSIYIDSERRNSLNIDKIYSYEQEDLDNFKICINNLLGYVNIKWDWTQSNLNPMNNSNNIRDKLCIFIPEFISNKIYKEIVTELCQIIIYVFQAPMTYSEGFRLISNFIRIKDKAKLKQQIFESVVYLINLNVLIVSHHIVQLDFLEKN